MIIRGTSPVNDDHLTIRTGPRPISLTLLMLLGSSGLLATPWPSLADPPSDVPPKYESAVRALDAYVAREVADKHLPALSIDWGYWADPSGLTAHLTGADRRRIARGGLLPLSAEEGRNGASVASGFCAGGSDSSGRSPSSWSMVLARPQSTTRVSPNLPSMMLPGFRSR